MGHVHPKRLLAGGRCSDPSAYTPPGTELSAAEPYGRMPLAAQLLVVVLPMSSGIALAMVVIG